MRGVRIVAAVCVVALAVLAVLTGVQAWRIHGALDDLNQDFVALNDRLLHSDLPGARRSLAEAQGHARTIRDNAHGIGWWLASGTPGLSDDVAATRMLGDVAVRTTTRTLPVLLDAVKPLLPANVRAPDGQIRLAGLTAAAPVFARASRALQADADLLDGIDTTHLGGAVRRQVIGSRTGLAKVAQLSRSAAKATELLPKLLGGSGERTYLLAVLNNAELRATGGIPGAFALLHAKDGRLTFSPVGGVPAFGLDGRPVLPLTPDERAIYQPEMAATPQDTTLTPDFPRSAQLLAAMWARHHDPVDGVVATDPVALAELLQVSGPVTVPGGVLTAQNAVPVLLNSVYRIFPDSPGQQDAYFAQSAQAVFGRLGSGAGDSGALLGQLAAIATQRRFMVWSAHADEQKALDQSLVTGALETEPSRSPEVGVFLNDGTGGKLDYYLDARVDLHSTSCSSGQQRLQASITLHSRVPVDAHSNLPLSVRGTGVGRTGRIRTTITVYAPVGGQLDSFEALGNPAQPAIHTQGGRQLAALTVDVPPSGSLTLSADLVSGPDQREAPRLRVTPTAALTPVNTVGPTTCS